MIGRLDGGRMRLLMIDLDNSLIDRDAAFRDAAGELLAAHGLPAGELAWVMAADGGGFTPRGTVAAALTGRFPGVPPSAIRRLLDDGGADRVVLAPEVAAGLRRLTGWTVVIVTNGRAVQQRAKIVNTGLDRLVDGWVISEEAGHRKPGAEIFQAAAAIVGMSLAGAWMIGDSARADIAGAAALGLTSVWIANGRRWCEPGLRPTHVAGDIVAALNLIPADQDGPAGREHPTGGERAQPAKTHPAGRDHPAN